MKLIRDFFDGFKKGFKGEPPFEYDWQKGQTIQHKKTGAIATILNSFGEGEGLLVSIEGLRTFEYFTVQETYNWKPYEEPAPVAVQVETDKTVLDWLDRL